MHFIRSFGYSSIWCLVQVAQRYKHDKYFSCIFAYAMHAALLLPKSPLISSYQQKKRYKVISICFYCWWVEDASFHSPIVGSCINTHIAYPSSLQCNFSITNRLVTAVLRLLSVIRLSSAFSQSNFLGFTRDAGTAVRQGGRGRV